MIHLIKYNIKILRTPSYWLGWVFLLCIPTVFSFKFLNEMELIKISGQMFILVGIIWFGSLLHYEQANNMIDLIYQMPIKQSLIFLIRVLFIVLNMSVAFLILFFIAYLQGASFSLYKLFSSSMVGALVLGLVTLLFSQITKNTSSGYMVGFAYYYFEVSTKGVYTKYFYLFGTLADIPFNRIILLGVCIFLLIANWLIVRLKSQ